MGEGMQGDASLFIPLCAEHLDLRIFYKTQELKISHPPMSHQGSVEDKKLTFV